MPLMAVIDIQDNIRSKYIQFRIDDNTSIKIMLGPYPDDGITSVRIVTAMAEPPYYIITTISSSSGAGGVANILL